MTDEELLEDYGILNDEVHHSNNPNDEVLHSNNPMVITEDFLMAEKELEERLLHRTPPEEDIVLASELEEHARLSTLQDWKPLPPPYPPIPTGLWFYLTRRIKVTPFEPGLSKEELARIASEEDIIL